MHTGQQPPNQERISVPLHPPPIPPSYHKCLQEEDGSYDEAQGASIQKEVRKCDDTFKVSLSSSLNGYVLIFFSEARQPLTRMTSIVNKV